jgi:hypothetical protein
MDAEAEFPNGRAFIADKNIDLLVKLGFGNIASGTIEL